MGFLFLSLFLLFLFWDQGQDALQGLALGPFLGKYSSLRDTNSSCKKRSVTVMDYKALETATNNFRETDILGEGGFGCVYKARLEENLYVAVKRLEGGTQDAIREFEVSFSFCLKSLQFLQEF